MFAVAAPHLWRPYTPPLPAENLDPPAREDVPFRHSEVEYRKAKSYRDLEGVTCQRAARALGVAAFVFDRQQSSVLEAVPPF
jgi:hypothetical protein